LAQGWGGSANPIKEYNTRKRPNATLAVSSEAGSIERYIEAPQQISDFSGQTGELNAGPRKYRIFQI
jgi:hypothetical protein